MLARSIVDTALLVILLGRAASQHENCTGVVDYIGDGFCDEDNNNAGCSYDGGDCCVCTCTDDRAFTCGAFYCLDPDAADGFYDCEEAPAVAAPCPTDLPLNWVVNDTVSATDLAEAVYCTGATFHVEWRGNIIVNHPIYVSGGTILSITGKDSGAAINGGGATRLFTVVNASLHTSNVNLINGSAAMGGAIAATSSNLSFNHTSFTGNFAGGDGGALFLLESSNATWLGSTVFSSNEGRDAGGAMYVERSSGTFLTKNVSFKGNIAMYGGAAVLWNGAEIHCEGGATVVDNGATRRGGGFFVGRSSILSWRGDAFFHNNVASQDGGVMVVRDGSWVSWNGKTSFHNNFASESGGALFIQEGSLVSWDGETLFHKNVASDSGGALLIQGGSWVSWDAETFFHHNVASQNGGAIFTQGSSWVSWDGNTTFQDNFASLQGGALCVQNYSRVSWAATTSFYKNYAYSVGDTFTYGFGGAVALFGRCSISWEAPTKFSNNWAGLSGGALDASRWCSVSWGSETTFSGNVAEEAQGGALAITAGSNASWAAETSFSENSAVDGGAVFAAFLTVVQWTGETSFARNFASFQGGAVSAAYTSDVVWGAETWFIENIAFSSGGAVHISQNVRMSWVSKTSFASNIANSSQGGAIASQSRCNISWYQETSFFNNTAAIFGGAVFVGDFHGEDIHSKLLVEGITMFQENRCGAGGGGISAANEVNLEFGSGLVTFWKNSAELTGGAMYLSSISYGPLFLGTRFISNSARVGGGVQALATGDAIDDFNRKFPAIFSQCEFSFNRAEVSGGAIESSAGVDVIVRTSFVGNSAGVGGAIRVAGATTVSNCSFVENMSDEDRGPTISNIGFMNLMEENVFVNNAFMCGSGMFLDYDESPADLSDICDECNSECTNCTYEGQVPTCVEVMEHASSGGINVTIETVEIDPGYWRATRTSWEVLACFNPDACLGGITGEPGFCRLGYEGPYCSVCSDGYIKGLGFVCNRCTSMTDGIAVVTVVGFLLVCALGFVILFLLSGHSERGNPSIMQRVIRCIPLPSLRIVIVVWQILTEFSSAANATYPGLYQRFLDGIDFINFDLDWLFSTGCLVDMDFHDRLLLSTTGPIVAMVLLGVTYTVEMWRHRDSDATLSEVRRRHLAVLLLLTFLVYSPVSSTLFQMSACERLDDGKNYLIVDYRIECDSWRHRVLQIYAGIMVLLYPIGIPLLYASLLFIKRDVLMDEDRREDDTSVGCFSDLWEPYRCDRYYYELVECSRRILLSGIVVFIYPNTAAQIAITLMVSAFFSVVFEVLMPYVSRWDTGIARAGHAIIFTSLYLALLLRVDVSAETSYSQMAFGVLLVLTHSFIILAVVAETIGIACSLRAEVKEVASPQQRRPGTASVDVLAVRGIPPPAVRDAGKMVGSP